jgi:hypothetical protein
MGSSRTRTVDQGSALQPACACPAPPERHDDQHRPVQPGPQTRNRPAFALVSPGVEPPAGIEPATPSLPWNHQEPLCEPPFPQVAPDRRGQSYRFSRGAVMRSPRSLETTLPMIARLVSCPALRPSSSCTSSRFATTPLNHASAQAHRAASACPVERDRLPRRNEERIVLEHVDGQPVAVDPVVERVGAVDVLTAIAGGEGVVVDDLIACL